mgnify:CR=1 FL=1
MNSKVILWAGVLLLLPIGPLAASDDDVSTSAQNDESAAVEVAPDGTAATPPSATAVAAASSMPAWANRVGSARRRNLPASCARTRRFIFTVPDRPSLNSTFSSNSGSTSTLRTRHGAAGTMAGATARWRLLSALRP